MKVKTWMSSNRVGEKKTERKTGILHTTRHRKFAIKDHWDKEAISVEFPDCSRSSWTVLIFRCRRVCLSNHSSGPPPCWPFPMLVLPQIGPPHAGSPHAGPPPCWSSPMLVLPHAGPPPCWSSTCWSSPCWSSPNWSSPCWSSPMHADATDYSCRRVQIPGTTCASVYYRQLCPTLILA